MRPFNSVAMEGWTPYLIVPPVTYISGNGTRTAGTFLSVTDRSEKGVGASVEMASLYRFWRTYLRFNFHAEMYREFRSLAHEDALQGYRFIVVCASCIEM